MQHAVQDPVWPVRPMRPVRPPPTSCVRPAVPTLRLPAAVRPVQRRAAGLLPEHPAPRLRVPPVVLPVHGVRQRAQLGGALFVAVRLRAVLVRLRLRLQLQQVRLRLRHRVVLRARRRGAGAAALDHVGGHRHGHRVQPQRLLLRVPAHGDVVQLVWLQHRGVGSAQPDQRLGRALLPILLRAWARWENAATNAPPPRPLPLPSSGPCPDS